MTERFEATVDAAGDGLRLDQYLAAMVEDASRSYLKKLVKDGHVSLNGAVCTKAARAVRAHDVVAAEVPPPPDLTPEPEDMPLDILHEDAELLIVNKPAGLVVHPAPGHYSGTLVNAVLHHCPDFQAPGSDLVRPGIVHRLDMYTSGVMVVAKTQRAFAHLGAQAAAHAFDRRYLAIVRGDFKEHHGRIDASIGRSTADRKKMTVTGIRAKEAVTNFEVRERFGMASLVALKLETGRTHQIRVHMRFAGRPILGDPIYGVADFTGWKVGPELRAALDALPGQALHAELLGIEHPATGEHLTFTAPPPQAFVCVLEALRAHAAAARTR
ncbi:MAG: RluA family pseudouridine synthase [Candidatus Hydrogenedentota bacterium]